MRLLALLLALGTTLAMADQTPAPANAEVYIIAPKDGAHVKSPVTVVFGLKNAGIAPAGIKFDNTGHHHLLVDADMPADLTLPLPVTEHIRHFGKGQTEASLELTPGKHTLQLLFADLAHVPFAPNVASRKITITVVP
jgi:Domain of unknown function (DUF4399)